MLAQVSDLTAQEFASEIIREKLWQNLNQEIPYELNHNITRWEIGNSNADNQLLRIECEITVPRPSLKPIVLGKKGTVIKRIVQAARNEMQERFMRPIALHINVKVI